MSGKPMSSAGTGNRFEDEQIEVDGARTFKQAPPPPYEPGLSNPPERTKPSHDELQTVPKTTVELRQANDTQHAASSYSATTNIDRFREQVASYNQRHTCTQRNADLSPKHPPLRREDARREGLVSSLAASRGLFGRLTIEPLSFLAMLAIYIEFPAIQDLIYTKICLELVTKNPHLLAMNGTSSSVSQVIAANATIVTNSTGLPVTFNLPSTATTSQHLPSSGRIQSTSGQISDLSPSHRANELPSSLSIRDHFLCNRKSSIPVELAREIIDVDSLFWFKYQIIISALCVLSCPYWGGISDKIGRLVPLNVPIICSIVCNLVSLIFGLLISLDSHALFHVNWLMVEAVLVGLSGGQTVLIMSSYSFVSDTTTIEDRIKRVTLLESVIFMSHSSGYFINKLIMSLGLEPPERIWLNRHFVAFLTCILLNLTCVLYSYFRLRHHKFHRFLNNFEREQQEAAIVGTIDAVSSGSDGSLKARNKELKRKGDNLANSDTSFANNGERLRELTSSTPDDLDDGQSAKDFSFWSTIVTFKYYKQTYLAAAKPRESRSIILLLLLCVFLSAMSLATLMTLLFIYVKMDPFNWTTSQYSMWNSISSITRGLALVSLTLCMRFVSNWSVPDPLIAVLGFLSKGVGLLMIGLAEASTLINLSLIAFVFSDYSMPPIRSLLSKLVVKDELGKIYSCLGALQSICFFIGNVAFYMAFKTLENGEFFKLSFIVVGALEFGAVIIMLMIYSSLRNRVLIV